MSLDKAEQWTMMPQPIVSATAVQFKYLGAIATKL